MTRPPSPARLVAARFAKHSDAELRLTVRVYQKVRQWWPCGRFAVTQRRVAKLELQKRGVSFSHLIGG